MRRMLRSKFLGLLELLLHLPTLAVEPAGLVAQLRVSDRVLPH